MIGVRFFDREMETQVTREEMIKHELARVAADKAVSYTHLKVQSMDKEVAVIWRISIFQMTATLIST